MTRDMVRGYTRQDPYITDDPLQAHLGCPWRVVVASVLLCRARRQQAEAVLVELLQRYPTPGDMARAVALEELVKPCGLHRNRARALQRISVRWTSDDWYSITELPGVGTYVADSVGLFCFGLKDLDCSDHVLLAWRDKL